MTESEIFFLEQVCKNPDAHIERVMIDGKECLKIYIGEEQKEETLEDIINHKNVTFISLEK